MLKHLYIKNFTIIDTLDIDFNHGFSVISGETGAGKSIILGAISLLLGSRADIKQIKSGENKCIIEAIFEINREQLKTFFDDNNIDFDENETILRREINSKGKSRAFINDSPVSLTLLKTLGGNLIDIHSQHQNLLLQKENFQLRVIDIIAQNQKYKDIYEKAYFCYKETENEIDKLKNDIAEGIKNQDFMRFQYEELSKAKLQEGQQELLEEESKTLSHAEEIKSALFEINNNLNNENTGAVLNLNKASDIIESLSAIYSKTNDLSKRLNTAYIEIKDIADEINLLSEEFDFNPNRLEEVTDKLDIIYHLQQKFHVKTITELLAIQENIQYQLDSIENSDETLKKLENKLNEELLRCKVEAKKLTLTRLNAAKIIKEDIIKRLIPMGIPNIQFEVKLSEKPLSSDGMDKVQFLFSANKNIPLQPIAQIASGGEIARVMLSLKAMISHAVQLPTIIFDEIDTGVSGKIAQQMAFTMKEMGENKRQVISITHLPQIAALGTTHYKVEKKDTENGTTSKLRMLSDEERVREIAQMLSGTNITSAALQNARELLKNKIQ